MKNRKNKITKIKENVDMDVSMKTLKNREIRKLKFFISALNSMSKSLKTHQFLHKLSKFETQSITSNVVLFED